MIAFENMPMLTCLRRCKLPCLNITGRFLKKTFGQWQLLSNQYCISCISFDVLTIITCFTLHLLQADGIRERLSEQQYSRLVDYVVKSSPHLIPSQSSLQLSAHVVAAEPPPTNTKTYQFLVEAPFARVFISKFKMVKNKALHRGFH